VRLELRVADSGIGMTSEQVGRLFQPFSQADNSTTRRYGGTGLGLSIVRRLAELMGGKASVESEAGKGSTFTVSLDLALASRTAAPCASRSVGRSGNVAGTVLAVDDYPMNLEVLKGQLEILGGEARMPIVALTANALKGEAERCHDAGMDGYLTKPLTLEKLRETIERWMSEAPRESAREDGAAAADAAIDRDFVARMFGDNPALVDRMLRRFAEAGAALIAEIAAATDDPAALGGLAHKLKGAARAAGAIRLGDLAAAVEQSKDPANVAPLMTEWQRVDAALGERASA
jgi:HPt (histidine-containing phosphotransfer) domain-containing protein